MQGLKSFYCEYCEKGTCKHNKKMVVRCSRCMGYKNSYISPCKKYKRRRSRQRGRGIKSLFKNAKKLAKKTVNSDIAKMVKSQELTYAPKIYDMVTSKIANKKVKKLLQSEMAKILLNKGLDKA